MIDALDFEWGKLLERLRIQFGKKPDMEAILFLIGIREFGRLPGTFTKEEKQDLMHIATCRVLSEDGYYELEHLDQDGWPHWRALKPLAATDLMAQEQLLKKNILTYFREMEIYGE